MLERKNYVIVLLEQKIKYIIKYANLEFRKFYHSMFTSKQTNSSNTNIYWRNRPLENKSATKQQIVW